MFLSNWTGQAIFLKPYFYMSIYRNRIYLIITMNNINKIKF